MRKKILLVLSIAALSIGANAQTSRVPSYDGNRYISGAIDVPYSVDVTIPFDSEPVRVVGTVIAGDAVWFVKTADDQTYRITLSGIDEVEVGRMGRILSGGFLPAVDTLDARNGVFRISAFHDNKLTLPTPIEATGSVAAVDASGNLLVSKSGRTTTYSTSLLVDGHLLQDETGALLVLKNPSDRYRHGILGDTFEPTALSIVDTRGRPAEREIVELSEADVFETLSPIWTDLDGDGEREIIITKSSPRSGANLQVYSESGRLLAESEPIGTPYRWMHLLAVAPTAPNGGVEIIAVKTPHIAGTLEYYRMEGASLKLIHSVAGVSTHTIGSRNIDTAIAGDFDDDGRIEILLPSDDFSQLLMISRVRDGSEIDHTIYLDGSLTSNIAAIDNEGDVSIAFGTSEGDLVIVYRSF